MPGLNCMAVGLTDTLFWPMQVSEAAALQRPGAAESSNVQLTQLAEDHQRVLQDYRDVTAEVAAPAWLLQALEIAENTKNWLRSDSVPYVCGARCGACSAQASAHAFLGGCRICTFLLFRPVPD